MDTRRTGENGGKEEIRKIWRVVCSLQGFGAPSDGSLEGLFTRERGVHPIMGLKVQRVLNRL